MRNLLVLAALSLANPLAAGAETPASGAVAMVPARLVSCTLGRALNIDPAKEQSLADLKFEGAHRFSLFLPPVPQDHGPPPEPSADPEPVDPAVRVVEDPDGIARDMLHPFYRVADRWPERVELVGRIAGETVVRFLVVSEIDPAKGTANLFMTRARDAGSLDLRNVYQGGCKVTFTPAAH